MNKDKHKTMVIFRIWKDTGACIALMPMSLERLGYCDSYMHIGQHGAAGYMHVLSQSRPAKPEECIDLADEMKDIGYNLAIRQKHPSHAYSKKWLAMGNR